jgi:hypothetical protein
MVNFVDWVVCPKGILENNLHIAPELMLFRPCKITQCFPRYDTWPVVGVSRPSKRRAMVLLPLPLSPTTEMIEGKLGSTDSEKSRSATTPVVLNIPR